MIEPGTTYNLKMVMHNDDGQYDICSRHVTVTRVDGGLIEIDGYEVLNTASPLFHSLTDEQAREEHFGKLQSEMDTILNQT